MLGSPYFGKLPYTLNPKLQKRSIETKSPKPHFFHPLRRFVMAAVGDRVRLRNYRFKAPRLTACATLLVVK